MAKGTTKGLGLNALRALVDAATITLDGVPATVTGWTLGFRTVRQTEGIGYGWEYSDETIEHVIRENGGAFKS